MYKAIRSAALLFLLLALLCAVTVAAENKTAYTRDGVHFVSKERMEENIKYQYAKAGEYREVQVPPDAIIVGASIIPEQALEESEEDEKQSDQTQVVEKRAEAEEDTYPPQQESETKYPYAALGIGLLLALGLVASAAQIRGKRRRRGRRRLKRR